MRKFLKGFHYAFKGLGFALRTQVNFRFQIFVSLVVLISGAYAGLTATEWLWIVAAISAVLAAELGNTAIEELVNLVSPGHHPKAGIIKDLSAAVVLIAAAFSAATGLIIFLPKLIHAL